MHYVVGNVMKLRWASLADEIGDHLAVGPPVDGEEEEYLTGEKSSLNLRDELVVPLSCIETTLMHLEKKGLPPPC